MPDKYIYEGQGWSKDYSDLEICTITTSVLMIFFLKFRCFCQDFPYDDGKKSNHVGEAR